MPKKQDTSVYGLKNASAKKREAKMLAIYRSNHGKNPMYNKNCQG